MFILDFSLSNVVFHILAAIKLKFLRFCWRLLYLSYFQCVLREPSESKRAKVLIVLLFNKSIKLFNFKRANKMLKSIVVNNTGGLSKQFLRKLNVSLMILLKL